MSVAATVTMVVAGALLSPATAPAAPGDGGEIAVSPQLSLASLGADPTVALFGAEGVATLTVPVSAGLVPAAIDAVVEIPVNMAGGVLTVTQGDRTLSRIGLGPDERTPISIPLADALVVDDAVSVVLRSYLTPIENYCFDQFNPLRLLDATVRYDGAEAVPSTVADFLPPVLQQLDIFLPAQPSRAETGAAVRLATAVVARYGKQRVSVGVFPLGSGEAAPSTPSLPLQRHVVIREADAVEVSLLGTVGVPALLITGPASELTNQTGLLTSELTRLAASSKATVGEGRPEVVKALSDTTIADLGQPNLTATAVSPQVSIAVDQTWMGHSLHGVRVQLRGSYTPLPATLGGQLVAAIAGQVVGRWPADASGTIDRWVDVPDGLLQRYTSLGVTLQVRGNAGRCAEAQPGTLTIDGDTRVTSSTSPTTPAGGLQSVPQALMPVVQIGVNDGIDDARRATSLLVGLQRLSALPLNTTVVDLKDAMDSANSAVLISAEGWVDNRLTLPIAVDKGGQVTVQAPDGSGSPTTLKLDPTTEFGSLQTVYDGSRTVLIATSNGAPGQLDALLDWVNSDNPRWSSVKGTALISMPGQDPVAFGGAGDAASSEAEPAADRSALYWGIGAAAAVLIAAGLAWIVLRRRATGRRHRKVGGGVDGERESVLPSDRPV